MGRSRYSLVRRCPHKHVSHFLGRVGRFSQMDHRVAVRADGNKIGKRAHTMRVPDSCQWLQVVDVDVALRLCPVGLHETHPTDDAAVALGVQAHRTQRGISLEGYRNPLRHLSFNERRRLLLKQTRLGRRGLLPEVQKRDRITVVVGVCDRSSDVMKEDADLGYGPTLLDRSSISCERVDRLNGVLTRRHIEPDAFGVATRSRCNALSQSAQLNCRGNQNRVRRNLNPVLSPLLATTRLNLDVLDVHAYPKDKELGHP